MDVKLSIGEADIGTSNPIEEEVKKDEIDSLKEEEIWRTRPERIKNALVGARAAARQEPADLYAAASRLGDVIERADVEEFISEIERLAVQTDPSATFNFHWLPSGSILHIAVLAGKGDILRLLLDNVHDHIVATQDEWGDTALHIATKAKEIGFIDMLIDRVKDLPNGEDKLLLRMKNNHGNTALHEAVLKGDVGLVSHLLGKDLEPVYLKNVDEKSPLYLALDNDNSELHQVLFTKPLKPWKIEGMPPVHGAIMRRNYDLIAQILEWNMKLFAMTDSGGGNVFHLAAFLNWAQVFDLLQVQPKTRYLAREQDMNGDLPIHIASKMGHFALIEKLHRVSQSVNGQGQTVLHVAAKYGQALAVRDMLKHPDLGMLINERDQAGNTPLHLATMHLQPATLIHLMLDERINPCLLNHKRLIAVEIALNHPQQGMQKDLAKTLLSSILWKRLDLMILKPEAREDKYVKRSFPIPKDLKNGISTLLLVATLVTTVTFAAGFAVPGGLNSSDMASKADKGMATMLNNRMFQAFVICNTIAMFCSMASVVGFMWAHLSEVHLAIIGCILALVPLIIALPTMTAAFSIGVTLTVGKLPWLAIVILSLGSIFILIITGALLLPVVVPLLFIPFYWDRLRPIRPLTSRFILAYIKLIQVETKLISHDSEEDKKGSKTSASPPLGGGGKD